MKKIVLFSLFLISFIVQCGKEKHVDVIRSFCYWKTYSPYYEGKDTLMKQMKLKHLYVRFFDVGFNPYDKKAYPIASLNDINFQENVSELTPSIFISNDVLLNATKSSLDTLSFQIKTRTTNLLSKFVKNEVERISNAQLADTLNKKKSKIPNISLINQTITNKFKTLLIDCDWSEKSKENYFYLLEKLKKEFSSFTLQATIRLYQYKYYEKTGIPPVTNGLLMCYNITNPTKFDVKNSIATVNDFKDYITHNKYPLKLDIALPLFSWNLVFRGSEFKGILSEDIDFKTPSNRFKKVDETHYAITDDFLAGTTYLRNGDEIRIEKISNDDLIEMISVLKENIKMSGQTKVTFFSFDEKYITNYGTSKINTFYEKF